VPDAERVRRVEPDPDSVRAADCVRSALLLSVAEGEAEREALGDLEILADTEEEGDSDLEAALLRLLLPVETK